TLVATANHPLRTPDGWTPIGKLRAGDRVACARTLPALPERQADALADFLARAWERDGTFTYQRTATLLRPNDELSKIQHLLLRFGIVARIEGDTLSIADRESLA